MRLLLFLVDKRVIVWYTLGGEVALLYDMWAGKRERFSCAKKIAPETGSLRGWSAGCFRLSLSGIPAYKYERLASDLRVGRNVERNQRAEVHHTVTLLLHVEHWQKQLELGIVWEFAAA